MRWLESGYYYSGEVEPRVRLGYVHLYLSSSVYGVKHDSGGVTRYVYSCMHVLTCLFMRLYMLQPLSVLSSVSQEMCAVLTHHNRSVRAQMQLTSSKLKHED